MNEMKNQLHAEKMKNEVKGISELLRQYYIFLFLFFYFYFWIHMEKGSTH